MRSSGKAGRIGKPAWQGMLAVLALLVPVLLLSGCGSQSITPGFGGGSGLGTPGTGTGDPDGSMAFTLRGTNAGDFEAGEVRADVTFLGLSIQGIMDVGTGNNRVVRVGSIRFDGIPVAGRTYRLDGTGTDTAELQYSEQRPAQSKFSLWSASSGTVHVDRVTADHVEGTFQGTLDPATNATGELTVRDGEFKTLYHAAQ